MNVLAAFGMTRPVRRFQFRPGVDMSSVEAALVLATLAAEATHGRTQVRLQGDFELRDASRELVCDIGSPVGETIASVLTLLLARMLGEEAFEVLDPAQGRHAPENGRNGSRQ